jgi:amino acid adenylation domain-containing protein
LVLRVDLKGNPAFGDVVRRARTVTLNALDHQDVPLQQLVEVVHARRFLNRNPLFDVMINFRNIPEPAIQLHGIEAEPLDPPDPASEFALSLEIADHGETFAVQIVYQRAIFADEQIASVLADFESLLRQGVAAPMASIDSFAVSTRVDAPSSEASATGELSQAERRTLLVDWNPTHADFPLARMIHELVEAQVARTPDATAVIIGDEKVTYAELNSRANRLASQLRDRGVRPETVVGICLERSINLVAAQLAVAKAGGAFLPMEPRDPAARLKGMVDDGGAHTILASARSFERLQQEMPGAAVLDCDQLLSAGQSDGNLPGIAKVDHLFYVMFTSGSTGRPKGVMISHRAFFNYLHAESLAFPLTAADRVLQRSPVVFDVSVWEMLAPLAVGGAVVMPSSPSQFDPAECVTATLEHGVTVVQMVPPLLGLLLDEPGVERCHTLRRVFCGGAPLTPDLRSRFFECLPRAELVNLYGPTETCVYATAWTCAQGDRSETVPIGRPFANTELYVLGPHLQLLPIGASGELFIGGTSLSRGYINRHELTAERFIPHPFSDEPGARLYRTGDRVRYLSDGNLEFLGRLDDQVKIHGVRVELSEVEAAIGAHPLIQQVAVTAPADANGERQLVAYYVPREPEPSTTELRHFLQQVLPDSMVPSTFMRLDALPLTTSGKIDRRSLPAPVVMRSSGDRLVAPRNQIETSISEVWRQALHVDAIGVHDNFFELGGHSLLAVQVTAKIRTTCGLDLPLRALFESPTIAGLAARAASNGRVAENVLVPFREHGTKAPFFCIHGLGGEVQAYGELARLLDPDRPFLGIRAPFADGQRMPTIEAMATRYIAEIRSSFPKGPYFLGGYSAGAALAYEMAQQLTSNGERVPLVIALDSRLPNTARSSSASTRTWVHSLTNLWWWTIDDLMEANGYELAARFRSKTAMLARRLAAIPGLGWLRLHTQTDIRDRLGIPWVPKELGASLEQLFASHTAYKPRVYSGKVALFRARTRPLFRLWEPDLGWSKFAKGGVEIHTVRGSHSNILREPNVRLLAAAVRQSLDAAERATSA